MRDFRSDSNSAHLARARTVASVPTWVLRYPILRVPSYGCWSGGENIQPLPIPCMNVVVLVLCAKPPSRIRTVPSTRPAGAVRKGRKMRLHDFKQFVAGFFPERRIAAGADLERRMDERVVHRAVGHVVFGRQMARDRMPPIGNAPPCATSAWLTLRSNPAMSASLLRFCVYSMMKCAMAVFLKLRATARHTFMGAAPR